MSGGRGGSAWSAGCGAMGLLSLLIGVGITFWLAGRVLDDTTGGSHKAEEAKASLAVDPATGLSEGQQIGVTGSDFAVGSTVVVRICARPEAGKAGCDASTRTEATADVLGGIQTQLTAHRLLRLPGGPIDCASKESHCEVRATVDGALAAPPIALTFGS